MSYWVKRNSQSIMLRYRDLKATDVAKELSKKKVIAYMGRGIEFLCKDEKLHKLWHDILDKFNFYENMFRVERNISECGSSIITINKDKEGLTFFDDASMIHSNGVEMSWSGTNCAVVIRYQMIDNQPKLMRCAYDTEKVVTTMWNADSKQQINIMEFVAKLPKDLQEDYGEYDKEHNAFVRYHNLGVCPVVVMNNWPYKPLYNSLNAGFYYQSPFNATYMYESPTSDFNQLSDTAAISLHIAKLNFFYERTMVSGQLMQPKIFVNVSDEQTRKTIIEGENSFFDNNIISVGKSNSIQVFSPPDMISPMRAEIEATKQEIYEACGIELKDSGSAQKTASESYKSVGGTISLVEALKQLHTSNWKKVIYLMFKMMGHDLNETKWDFEVKENIAIDTPTRIDNQIKLLAEKIITPIEVRQVYKNVELEEAEEQMKTVQEWYKQHPDYEPINMGGANAGVDKKLQPSNKTKPETKVGK